MPIQIGGKVNINAPREQVWEMIFDVETMKNVIGRIPGITLERLEQVDELTYELTAVVGVAAVKGKYDGKISVLEKTVPSYVKIKGEGKGGGNWTSGEVALNLVALESMTEMAYNGQGNLNGPLASLGQRLVDTVGKQFIDQGAKVLAQEIEQRIVPAVPVPVAPPPPYGFVFQALYLSVVMGAVIAIVVALALQSVPR
jgi:carbon monoxide dehydrogenase subunit G